MKILSVILLLAMSACSTMGGISERLGRGMSAAGQSFSNTQTQTCNTNGYVNAGSLSATTHCY